MQKEFFALFRKHAAQPRQAGLLE